MAVSLGVAVTLEPGQALLVFAALGIGMALPYVLASCVPAVARMLPRPGPWMVTFRQGLAFPLFATVGWLVWVLGQQTGIDGAAALLLLLVVMSAVIWTFRLRGRARTLLATFAVVLLVFSGWTAVPTLTVPTSQKAAQTSAGPWADWSPREVERALGAGQAVFVDFTAAWCVTCQYNKRTVLSDPSVLAGLSGRNVAMLRADWTLRDPEITQALAKLGRSGVPVYVFYRSGSTPVVLSTLPTAEEILTVVDKL